MAISFIQAATSLETNAATQSVSLTGVTAGNLLVAVVFWEGSTTTVSVSDGTDTFTNGAAGVNPDTVDGAWDIRHAPAYLLVGNGGDLTFTVTLGATKNTVVIAVLEFSTTLDSWALDGQASYGYGNSAAMTSGALTTTGAEVVCVSFGRNWGTAGDYASQVIGGNAATEATDTSSYTGYTAYYIGSISSGVATATCGSSQWLNGLIAFAAESSGPAAPVLSAAQVASDIDVDWV